MSCLFRSLSVLLRYKIGPVDVQKFRNYICDRLLEHFEYNIGDEKLKVWLEYCNLDENNNLTPAGYVQRMRTPGQWGGAPEIAIASKYYNVIIKVSYNGRIVSKFDCGRNPTEELTLLYTGGHYEPGGIVNL